MDGLFYARAALMLMACVAGGLLAGAALCWCVACLWIALEPVIREKLDARDRRRSRQDPAQKVEIRTDWRRRHGHGQD